MIKLHVNLYIYIHFTLKMEAARPSEVLVSYHITAWCHNIEDLNLNTQRNVVLTVFQNVMSIHGP